MTSSVGSTTGTAGGQRCRSARGDRRTAATTTRPGQRAAPAGALGRLAVRARRRWSSSCCSWCSRSCWRFTSASPAGTACPARSAAGAKFDRVRQLQEPAHGDNSDPAELRHARSATTSTSSCSWCRCRRAGAGPGGARQQQVPQGQSFFRTAFYFPSVTSSIAITLVFLFLFSGAGAVNPLLELRRHPRAQLDRPTRAGSFHQRARGVRGGLAARLGPARVLQPVLVGLAVRAVGRACA